MSDHKAPHPSLPGAVIAAQARQAREREARDPEAARDRPADFGGAALKLTVPKTIPGYHLYWANDQNAEIEMLLDQGFDIVRPSEIGLDASTRKFRRVVADDDIADSYSKYVGTKEDGSPLRAYLLKCPEEVWAEREAMRMKQADVWDGAIRAGSVENVENRYTPRGHETKLVTR